MEFVGTTEPVAVAVDGDTDVLVVGNDRFTLLCLHLGVAESDLDSFDVLGRSHPDGELQDFTPADWSSPAAGERVRRSSGNLAALNADDKGYFEMDVSGLCEIVIRASADTDPAEVTAQGSLS